MNYKISFDLTANAFATIGNYDSILRLTSPDASQDNVAGYRIPAFWFQPGSTQLYIDYFPLTGYNYLYIATHTEALVVGVKYHVTWELNG